MKKLYTLLILCAVCAQLHSQTLFNKLYASYSVMGDSIAMGFYGGVANDTTILLSGMTLDHRDTSAWPNYYYACFVSRLNPDGSSNKIAILREVPNRALYMYNDNIKLNSDQSVLVMPRSSDNRYDRVVAPFYLTLQLDTVRRPNVPEPDTNFYFGQGRSGGVFTTTHSNKIIVAVYKFPFRSPAIESDKAKLLYFDTRGNFLRYGPEYGSDFERWENAYDIVTLGANSMLLLFRNNQLLRLDSLGNILWQYDYPGQFTFYKVRQSPDGHYVMAGERYYYDAVVRANIYRPYMMKVNSQTGAVLWDYYAAFTTGGSEFRDAFKDLVVDSLGNCYTVCTGVSDPVLMDGIAYFVKVSSSGQLVFRRILNRLHSGNYRNWHDLDKIMPLPNGQFLLAGTITKGNVMQYGWLVKVDSMGQVMTITGNTEAPEAPEAMLRASPNPSSGGMVVFDYAVPEQVAGELDIYVHDISGRQVARLGLPEGGSGSAYWSTAGLPAGVYVYTLKAGGRVLASEQLVVY